MSIARLRSLASLESIHGPLKTSRKVCPICLTCCLSLAGPSRARQLSTSLPRFRVARSDNRKKKTPPSLSIGDFSPGIPPSTARVMHVLRDGLDYWAQSKTTRDMLWSYGFDPSLSQDLLQSWRVDNLKLLDGIPELPTEREIEQLGWGYGRIQNAIGVSTVPVQGIFLRHFLNFAMASPITPPELKERIGAILSVTDLTRLAFQSSYLPARSITRHFHLHIGPTNSGKTYNALKALSKAKTGAYAGPLRLLAHEVWERLNLGTVGELNGVGRACNLLTGEERRVVAEDAGLSSCTVEMLPLTGSKGGEGYDVVVIDEIQMLGDTQRGGAWTAAVLGVKSKEVHLCGDETTVGLLEHLIKSLGDEMTVHRYERLTPLEIGKESLQGDFGQAEPGDCFVTFSRTNIFTVKKMIEQTAGRKCAVVYGALPPETRAEQAKDFNEGRAEVLVASDAVGMGLNLKIKRMIFESLHKFNGKEDVPLALTQIKQIAGRAGRFGMHQPSPTSDGISLPPSPLGGIVTTLHQADLPVLRGLLPQPLPGISRAILDIPHETLSRLNGLLPPMTSYSELLSHLAHLVNPPPYTSLMSFDHRTPIAELIEPYRDHLDLAECEMFSFSPINHRDPRMVSIFNEVLRAYAGEGCVKITEAFKESRLIPTLELVEGTLSVLPPIQPLAMGRKPLVPPVLITSIPLLESLHKAVVLYLWLSFRLSLAFPDRALAVELKERTEKALEACLKRLPGIRNRKNHEIPREQLKEQRQWRKTVAPNGTRKDVVKKGHQGSEGKGVNWNNRQEIRKRSEAWRSSNDLVPSFKESFESPRA